MMVIAPVRFCWVGLDGLERLQCGRGILRETTSLFEWSVRRADKAIERIVELLAAA
jgi:hypothetical protein